MTNAMDSVAFTGFMNWVSRAVFNTFSNIAPELQIDEDIEWEGAK